MLTEKDLVKEATEGAVICCASSSPGKTNTTNVLGGAVPRARGRDNRRRTTPGYRVTSASN